MQFEILNLISPIFLVIITGFILGRVFKIFKPELANALIQFGFYVAVPALLLMVLTTTPIKSILNWPFILVYGGGTLAFFLAVILIVKLIFKKSLAESAIISGLSSLTNMGFVGLPLLLALFGHKAVAPATLSILILVLALYPLLIIVLEIAMSEEQRLIQTLAKTFKSVIKNPVVLPSIIGVIFSAFGWTFPVMIQSYFKILAGALTPCALFAVGLGIQISSIKGYFKDVVAMTVLKLVVLPALIFVFGTMIGLSPFYIIAAVIAVAVPPAKTVYLIASQYDVIKDEAAATISFATMLSIVTLFVWLIFFAHRYPVLFIK